MGAARIDPTTRAYLACKEADSKSRIAMRCVKRHLARRYYRLLSEGSRPRASYPAIAGCCAGQTRPVVSVVCQVEAGSEGRRVPRYSRRRVAGPRLVDTANAVLQVDVSTVGTSHQTGRSMSGAFARNALRPRASYLRSSFARTRYSRTPCGLRPNSGWKNARQGIARGRFAADFCRGGEHVDNRQMRASPTGSTSSQFPSLA